MDFGKKNLNTLDPSGTLLPRQNVTFQWDIIRGLESQLRWCLLQAGPPFNRYLFKTRRLILLESVKYLDNEWRMNEDCQNINTNRHKSEIEQIEIFGVNYGDRSKWNFACLLTSNRKLAWIVLRKSNLICAPEEGLKS